MIQFACYSFGKVIRITPFLNFTLGLWQWHDQKHKTSQIFKIFNVTYQRLVALCWKILDFHNTTMTYWKGHWHDKQSPNSPFWGVTCLFLYCVTHFNIHVQLQLLRWIDRNCCRGGLEDSLSSSIISLMAGMSALPSHQITFAEHIQKVPTRLGQFQSSENILGRFFIIYL